MTAHCVMEWVKASALPLLAVAVSGMSVLVVAVFSFWQVRIAREKLRHDLYDRRFAIYMAFHKLMAAMVDEVDMEDVRIPLRKANNARAHSPFLLDAKLGAYLKALHEEAFRLVETPKLINALTPSPAERIPMDTKFASDKLHFADKAETDLVREFEPFLKLKDFSKRS